MNIKPNTTQIRIGAVNFVNTLPLIDGLEKITNIELITDVPSALIDLVINDIVDVALCSVIDYQMSKQPLVIVPAGLLGCDGSTMTVRLFSSVPINRITKVHCDTDSHTSVKLMQIILHEKNGVLPELVEYDARLHTAIDGRIIQWPESVLLIGDKVVTDATPAIRYPYQLDLGAEWKEITGLPFVFATWLAKPDNENAAIAGAILDHQRLYNKSRIDQILNTKLVNRKWPIDLARLYLTSMICYDWNDNAQSGVELFFEKAYELGLIDNNHQLNFIHTKCSAL